ncbi:AraC family transcriptional regulator [Enterococcus gallinarum]|uniref:AraC family transcriptional regulator n=1 Tax=Enterococcus gallinarum TaxID=1353 RepID=UPI0012E29A70|nr:AraC family transcriptional regulator [Enterococcus gallinarum]MUO33535.1 helix-turn-helix domain-containing protein [Enterococcus gallinarum]
MNRAALESIVKKFYDKYLIPLFIFDEKQQVVIPRNSFITDKQVAEHFFLTSQSNELDVVTFFEEGDFFFSSFTCVLPDSSIGNVLIGPCGILGTNKRAFPFQGYDYIAGVHYSKESRESFVAFVELFYTILKGAIPDANKFRWSVPEKQANSNTSTLLEENLYQRRLEDPYLDSFEFEKRYVEAVRRNQPEKILWLFHKMSSTYSVELANNKLESLKYKYSGLITILTRVSINEGVPVSQAYGLSDTLLQKLQHIYDVQECLTHIQESTYHFMRLIHAFPTQKSFLIRSLINYIDTHIYDKITLNDLAEFTEKHPTHLSTEFKKHVGQTIHTYINQQKIAEAKHLLLFTDYSYKEIAALLHFSNQSHFIQVFKQFEIISPKEYRKNYFSSVFCSTDS